MQLLLQLMQKKQKMSNLQTERNAIIQELLKVAEKPEHVKFLMEMSTEISVDYIARNDQLKTQIQVLKNERDWMLNKILERVNK